MRQRPRKLHKSIIKSASLQHPYMDHVSVHDKLKADNQLFNVLNETISKWCMAHKHTMESVKNIENKLSLSTNKMDFDSQVLIKTNLSVCEYNLGCNIDLSFLEQQFKEYCKVVEIGYVLICRPAEPLRRGRWKQIEDQLFEQENINNSVRQYPPSVNFIYHTGKIIAMGSSNELYAKLAIMQQVRDLIALGLPVTFDPSRIVVKHSQLSAKLPFKVSEHVHELCQHFDNQMVWVAPKSIRSNFTARSTVNTIRVNFTTTGKINLFDCPSIESGLQAFTHLYYLLFLYRNHAPSHPVQNLLRMYFGAERVAEKFNGWIVDRHRNSVEDHNDYQGNSAMTQICRARETSTSNHELDDEGDDYMMDINPTQEMQELLSMETMLTSKVY